jgi:hypothetical protein
MNRIMRNSITSDGRLLIRIYRSGLALFAALCLLVLPTGAKAECGRFAAPGIKSTIKLPMAAQFAASSLPFEAGNPTIVGLWHVIYTNSVDQSTFNDTFDTWHSDGTEFESAFLAPAAGNICVGVWKQTGLRSVTVHHIGWIFNPGTPLATATNYFTLDEDITVAADNKSYSGRFTFKVWALDGSPTPVVATGTIAATRIMVN